MYIFSSSSGVSAHLLQCCAGQCEQFLPLNLLSWKVSNTGKSGQTKTLQITTSLVWSLYAVYATSTILKNMEWPMLVRLLIVNTQTVCSESALIPASYRHAWFVFVNDQSGNALVTEQCQTMYVPILLFIAVSVTQACATVFYISTSMLASPICSSVYYWLYNITEKQQLNATRYSRQELI